MVRFIKGHHFNQDKLKFIEFVKKKTKQKIVQQKQTNEQKTRMYFLSGTFHISRFKYFLPNVQ